MIIYEYDYPSHPITGTIQRTAFATKNIIEWVDARREQGWDAAKPFFPLEWTWQDVEAGKKPKEIADFSGLTGLGELLTPRAFEFFRSLVPVDYDQYFQVDVEGEPYFWVQVPLLLPQRFGQGTKQDMTPELIAAIQSYAASGHPLPPIFKMNKNARTRVGSLCTEQFKAMVEDNGLTGLVFKPFCETV